MGMTTAPVEHRAQQSSSRRDGNTIGAGLLIGLAFRRSRWYYLIWVVALWLTLTATRATYDQLVNGGDLESTMRELAANPTMRAMLGPPFDLLKLGGFLMFRVGTFVASAAAMMAALGTIRATRAEEEDGRTELLRSGVVGRHAPLLAGVVAALGACGLLGLLIVVSQSFSAPPFQGALATGLGIALVGAVWVGVGAVTAQLTESARAARGMALGILAAAFALRAVADGAADGSTLRSLNWLSPLDWAALARPYSGERWWVLLLPAALTAVLVAVAFLLESRRDLGAGIRPDKAGRAEAGPWLSSANGLAWRLERTSVLAWVIGLVLFGYAVGTLSGTVDQIVKDNPQMADLFRKTGRGTDDLRSAFYVTMLGILIVVIAVSGLQLIGRLGREEDRGRVEPMLATATSRSRLLTSYAALAFAVPSVLAVVTGAVLALPQGVSDGSGHIVGELAKAALALLPGVWLVVGLGTLLIGAIPRAFPLAWAVLGWSLFMSWVGQLLGMPKAITDLTPFAALPGMPVERMAWTPWIVEALIAALLFVLGLVAYRRRDIH